MRVCISTLYIDTCILGIGPDSHFRSSKQTLGVNVPSCTSSHNFILVEDPELRDVGDLLLLRVRRCMSSSHAHVAGGKCCSVLAR